MTERKSRPAADNSVQDVITVIEGYQSGPIRALAQDPPQNSVDARANGENVHVRYELFERTTSEGDAITLLTITDSGTTGLDGPMLTHDQLREREHTAGSLVIEQGENWAAWEAMRYTKTGEDKLGSRGQGKYAYLYHSAHPVPGAPVDGPRHHQRLIMLYDTMLRDGEYRLGVRYHNPSTNIIDPPYVDDEARETLTTAYEDEFFHIPLGLMPLPEPGTRVIIPFLGVEALSAFRDGTFLHWLSAQWWRKIQKGELSIDVVDCGGPPQPATVPPFWAERQWETGTQNYFVREQITLPSSTPAKKRIIKRVVLLQDDELEDTDVENMAQFAGVQLLRGGQWITTLPTDRFADDVPREHRKGFRGFVEFDRLLEGELRAIENPAHDGFNARTGIYKEILRGIEELVKEYATERGWRENDETGDADQSIDDLVRELAQIFVAPDSGSDAQGDVDWSCHVDATFPGATPKVYWGDRIRIAVTCTRRPREDGANVEFLTELIGPDGARSPILAPRHQVLRGRDGQDWSSAGVNLGTLDITLSDFPDAGRYSVRVSCRVDGEEVCSGRCRFFVAVNPPPPPLHTVTLQLVAVNAADGEQAVKFGEFLDTSATARNYGGASVVGAELIVTIEGEPYVLFRESVMLPGVAPGALPSEHRVGPDSRKVVERNASGDELGLSPGTHTVLASLEANGVLLASASVKIHVGPDTDTGGNLPFHIKDKGGDPAAPRWQLDDPGPTEPYYVMRWSTEDPVHKAVRHIRLAQSGTNRLPTEEFHSQNIAEALVEWAAREYRRNGDEGHLRLVGEAARSVDPQLAERLEGKLEELKSVLDDVERYGTLQRSIAASMVQVARELRS